MSDQEVFETLSNERRRYVVRRLLEEGRTNLRSLSRQVAARENDKPIDDVTPQERRRVYNALQQFHLPKLDESGVIDYDYDRGTVDSTDALDSLGPYVHPPEQRDRWRPSSVLVGDTVLRVASPVAVIGTLLGALSAAAWYATGRHRVEETTDEGSS